MESVTHLPDCQIPGGVLPIPNLRFHPNTKRPVVWDILIPPWRESTECLVSCNKRPCRRPQWTFWWTCCETTHNNNKAGPSIKQINPTTGRKQVGDGWERLLLCLWLSHIKQRNTKPTPTSQKNSHHALSIIFQTNEPSISVVSSIYLDVIFLRMSRASCWSFGVTGIPWEGVWVATNGRPSETRATWVNRGGIVSVYMYVVVPEVSYDQWEWTKQQQEIEEEVVLHLTVVSEKRWEYVPGLFGFDRWVSLLGKGCLICVLTYTIQNQWTTWTWSGSSWPKKIVMWIAWWILPNPFPTILSWRR